MSINYYAVPKKDESRVGGIVEGSDTADPIDASAVRAALLTTRMLKGNDTGTLTWESGSDYVFVDVLATHVLVTHNTGRGSYQIEVVMEALDSCKRAGLHVYDPQRGGWFFQ